MNSIPLRLVLKSLDFTSNLDVQDHVLLARHASDSYQLFMRDIEVFEEYQRFQADNSFGKCKYVVSFIGLPNKGQAATFAGIYKVVGVHRRGEAGFREIIGDPEFVAKWKDQDFLYDLLRLKEFDFLQLALDIQWNLPGPAKYQYLKSDVPIEVQRFAGCDTIDKIRRAIKGQLIEEIGADETAQDGKEFSEGAPYYAKHLRRERSAELIRLVKDNARLTNNYFCLVCKTDFRKIYGVDYIECHHTVPVSTLALDAKTKIEDMVLLCANCHRAVHKRNPWLKKEELHKLLIVPN